MFFSYRVCREINSSSNCLRSVPLWISRRFVKSLITTQYDARFPISFAVDRGLGTRRLSTYGRWRISPWGNCAVERSTFPLVCSRQCFATLAERERSSKAYFVYLTALAFAMVGCTYAAVPLYERFCRATGYGGTVQRRETVEEKIVRHAQEGTTTSREIVVQFNTDVADGLPWKFVPAQREVRVKPGESSLAFYTAENKSSNPITGVSTYNVTPMKAAIYFNKIQCFCFEEQRLLPGQSVDMPVFFYIDPEFETDPKMNGINNLILSYTFFKVSEEKTHSTEHEEEKISLV